MNAAQLLRKIRDHERQCQGQCAACQARLAQQREEITRQQEAEENIRQLLENTP